MDKEFMEFCEIEGIEEVNELTEGQIKGLKDTIGYNMFLIGKNLRHIFNVIPEMFKRKDKQTTFCYCPNCKTELISSNSFISDEEVVTYKCVKCGVISEWDFDAPSPILLKNER